MAKFQFTLQEMAQGQSFPAGQNHVITLLGARRVRLVGMFFDLNKCFLLPSAMHGVREIKNQYDQHPKSNLLVVGHTDTSGKDDYNLTLSLERSDAVAAYLTDDADVWDAFFADTKPAEKRWGIREVQSMLTVLPENGDPFLTPDEVDGKDGPITQGAVKKFQTSKGLKEDGIAGPNTRQALIQDYMALDGTSLPQGITLTTHGCGENFPVDGTPDGVRDPENRRVEIFFFDGPITPAPPGKTSAKGSKEYPAWLTQVTETVDVSGGSNGLDIPATLIGLPRPFFDAIPEDAQITFTLDSGNSSAFLLKEALDMGDDFLRFRIENPQPGVLFSATLQPSSGTSAVTLFQDFELHQFVIQPSNANAFQDPVLGQDTLVFRSGEDEAPNGAVVGGPQDTTPEQLATLDERAGTVLV